MAIEQIYERRSKAYSDFHKREFGKRDYMYDADWFELGICDNQYRIILHIESILVSKDDPWVYHPIYKGQSLWIQAIGNEGWHFPSYVVWHNKECTKFAVSQILKSGNLNLPPMNFSKKEYIDFINIFRLS